MKLFEILANYAPIINMLWIITLSATVVLYLGCNLLPDRLVGKFLPLHNVFKPHTNVDLDFQSIGYAMLHTTWLTRITHATIIIEAVFWFVIFQEWHWSVSWFVLALILVQSIFIGDVRFGASFFLMGCLTFAAGVFFGQAVGMENALLFSKGGLMLGGLLRMLSHSAELTPPLLLEDSDQFVKLSRENANWKLGLASLIGYVGEFGSSFPNRILPVQVNYIHQKIFGLQPQQIMPWKSVEESAQSALKGGYQKLDSLRNYYLSVKSPKL